MSPANNTHMKAVVGDISNDYWIYDSEAGFDLTRPWPVTSGPRKNGLTIQTSGSPIIIDPARTALVIVDMQNMFLSSALGRSADSKGLRAEKVLLDQALPAARKAGIQIAWLNWGLESHDISSAPPALHRSFGFTQVPADKFEEYLSNHKLVSGGNPEYVVRNASGKNEHIYVGLGNPLGTIEVDGTSVSAGSLLLRDQWNTQLTPALQKSYEAFKESSKPDVWLHKTRMSGFHTPDTEASTYFRRHKITTLFFAGVNTDQCVGGSLMDASAQGFDCIMLSDASATSSPDAAQECWEYNAARPLGFLTDCTAFAEGLAKSFKGSD